MKNTIRTLLDAVSASTTSLPFNVEEYSRVGLQFRADSVTSGQGLFTVDGTIDGQTWMRINTLISNVTNSNSQNLTRVASVALSTSVSHSVSASISPSASLSPSASDSSSPSASVSPSASASSSLSFDSGSLSPSASRSPSASASPSASSSLSRSPSASASPSSSASPSASVSPSISVSTSPSASVSPSPSLVADLSSSALVWVDPVCAMKALRVNVLVTGSGSYSAFAIAN